MKAELGSFDLDQGNVRGSNEIKGGEPRKSVGCSSLDRESD